MGFSIECEISMFFYDDQLFMTIARLLEQLNNPFTFFISGQLASLLFQELSFLPKTHVFFLRITPFFFFCISSKEQNYFSLLSQHNFENNSSLFLKNEPGIQISSCCQGLFSLKLARCVLCPYLVQDIVNFDEFSGHLTNEEQQQLLKYLPSIDTARLPDRFLSNFHFNSTAFK